MLQTVTTMNGSVGCVDGISIKHSIFVNSVALRYRRMKYVLFAKPPWGGCFQKMRMLHEF